MKSRADAGAAKAPPIEVESGAAFSLAQVVAGLFREAGAKRPRRAARLRGSLALQITDHTSGATVYFERERIRVVGNLDPEASVLVEAPVMSFAKLGSRGYSTRAYLRREIKVRGMLRHPLLLSRVRGLLAAL